MALSQSYQLILLDTSRHGPAELGMGGPAGPPLRAWGSPALGEAPQPRGREVAQPPHPLPGLGPQGRGPRKQLQGSLPTASAESLPGTGGTGAPALPSHPCPPTHPIQQAARHTGAPRLPSSASRPGATVACPPAAQDARPAGPWRPGRAAWGARCCYEVPSPGGPAPAPPAAEPQAPTAEPPWSRCAVSGGGATRPGEDLAPCTHQALPLRGPKARDRLGHPDMCLYVLQPGPDMPGVAGGAQQGLPPGTGLQIHRPSCPRPAAPPRPVLPEPGALTTTVMPSFSRGALS